MKFKATTIIRCSILATTLVIIWLTQLIPSWGNVYARVIYPHISLVLSSFSGLIPFSLGDLFIFLSIVGLILYPIYGRIRGIKWKKILLRSIEYLAWVYAWFYLAWGLNYSQYNFYQRTHTPYTAYTPENFQEFVAQYIENLNKAYVPITGLNKELIHRDIISGYKKISKTLGVHPPQGSPRVKTMMFTPFISKMAISGYMGPFFSEFNLNGDLPPSQYSSTYAHELAHLLGITGEAEANFYAFQVCTRSTHLPVRFCGYFSVLNHVLSNARRFLSQEEYKALVETIRPEIIELAQANYEYWTAKYSPLIGDIQDWIYDLYLKGNKIESGRKNYSEVVGLLISWQEHTKQ